jgi:hypothetical protein
MGQYSLRNTIVGMLYGRQGQVRKVLHDVIDAMIENHDADAIARVLEYVPESDAMEALVG